MASESDMEDGVALTSSAQTEYLIAYAVRCMKALPDSTAKVGLEKTLDLLDRLDETMEVP